MAGVSKVGRRDNAGKHRFQMSQHSGRRERMARKRHFRGTVTTSRSGWLTFKLGRKKSMEFSKRSMRTAFENSYWKKFIGCVVDAER